MAHKPLLIDVSIRRSTVCKDHEDFFSRYGVASYAHFVTLSEQYDIRSYTSASFSWRGWRYSAQWHFGDYQSPAGIARLILSLWKARPAIVFLHGFVAPLHVALLTRLIGKETRIVVQHHAEQAPGRLRRFFYRLAFAGHDAYLFAARELAGRYVETGIIRRPQQIYEVMEVTTDFRPLEKAGARFNPDTGKGIVFLWVGRLNQNKNPLLVLKALELFDNYHRDWVLHMIYGEDDLLRDINSFLDGSSIRSKVRLEGKKPHRDLEQWYSAADFYLSASRYEGSGLALCEALACGTTPLVPLIPSFQTMCPPHLAYFYSPGEVTDLVRVLRQASAFGPFDRQAVRAHFRQELSTEAIAGKMATLFHSLIQGSGQV